MERVSWIECRFDVIGKCSLLKDVSVTTLRQSDRNERLLSIHRPSLTAHHHSIESSSLQDVSSCRYTDLHLFNEIQPNVIRVSLNTITAIDNLNKYL